MAKKLLIKICGMRDPHNIKDIDGLNPDYIGIIFFKESPRNMDKNPDAIPATKAKKTGVFVNASIETIIKKAREFRLKTIQLHGNESPGTCLQIMDLGYEVIKAFKISDNTTVDEIKAYNGTCSAFLFDTKTVAHGGSGKKFDWKKLDELAPVGKFFLSGGIDPDDAARISELQYENLVGIDLNSKFEVKPGFKDDKKLKYFLSELDNHKKVDTEKELCATEAGKY